MGNTNKNPPLLLLANLCRLPSYLSGSSGGCVSVKQIRWENEDHLSVTDNGYTRGGESRSEGQTDKSYRLSWHSHQEFQAPESRFSAHGGRQKAKSGRLVWIQENHGCHPHCHQPCHKSDHRGHQGV